MSFLSFLQLHELIHSHAQISTEGFYALTSSESPNKNAKRNICSAFKEKEKLSSRHPLINYICTKWFNMHLTHSSTQQPRSFLVCHQSKQGQPFALRINPVTGMAHTHTHTSGPHTKHHSDGAKSVLSRDLTA